MVPGVVKGHVSEAEMLPSKFCGQSNEAYIELTSFSQSFSNRRLLLMKPGF